MCAMFVIRGSLMIDNRILVFLTRLLFQRIAFIYELKQFKVKYLHLKPGTGLNWMKCTCLLQSRLSKLGHLLLPESIFIHIKE